MLQFRVLFSDFVSLKAERAVASCGSCVWDVVSWGLAAGVRCESSVLGGASRRLLVSLGSALNSSHCPIRVKTRGEVIQVRFG